MTQQHPSWSSFALSLAPRFTGVTLVASGAMGTLFKAYDRRLRGPVALKLMRVGAARDRFAREARALAALQHPNIVRYVADGETRAGDVWLAMEWLDGEDLEVRLRRGPLSVRDTVALASCTLEALAAAHERGFLHRDLKPSNLMLVQGDITRVKIIDFGLGRLVQEADLTATGTVMGTLEYMPPEQA